MKEMRGSNSNSTLSLLGHGDTCDGCGECVTACREVMASPQRAVAIQLVVVDGDHTPLLCRNCHDAPCVAACMPGCRHKDETTGRVVTDYPRCVGCWMCVMVCPFGAIQRLPARPGEHHGVALKCDGCLELSEAPCVSACTRGALHELDPLEAAQQRRVAAAQRFMHGSSTANNEKNQQG